MQILETHRQTDRQTDREEAERDNSQKTGLGRTSYLHPLIYMEANPAAILSKLTSEDADRKYTARCMTLRAAREVNDRLSWLKGRVVSKKRACMCYTLALLLVCFVNVGGTECCIFHGKILVRPVVLIT